MALPDEGYSDGTHSEMTDSEMAFAGSEDDMSRLLSLALRLSPDQRKSVVEKLIESLPNHDKEAIARYCASLTHFDPSQYLPNELMLSVLSYLSPRDLLACGSVSRAWRDRALDEKLWRCCFAQEGWRLDGDKINKVEAAAADFLRRQGGYEPKGKARLMDWSPDPRTKPSLFRPGSVEEGRPRISWPYLFKHRTRLERNWEKDGSYGMFSLPHPNHPHEGHTECVYTVQFTPLYVVSGSRDRTIRRWDLTKRRLIGQPLVGHTASVLCLQFDERPRHDMIISGGSDANVIIWRFSSGEIVRKLDRAHDESVLNLRFDDRYLVTCSKDNVVKVWNRHAIDCDDPIVPTYKLDECANIPLSLDADGRIPEFTLLAQLLGHQAAVNAVMIHDNTIISASGDRSIRAWNIKEANMVKQYSGHAKGIACVQYDGRRIVSGSSDNTIRIYDAATQSEIACLIGHSNLVRTVQARFGDLDTVTDDMLDVRNNTQAAARADQPRTHAVDNNRIFKLQFDARRIICCSQNRVVVGWDFANGDRDLECVGDWCLETV
ncbi:WD40 repeat-like protein [Piedraia hortae CBS 480.64]|uniref:WD40 repeat-like protein n=1 Tax=Piedraia hortae CBS 480.64 TaxID=1314780 RepID=A0A6A7BZ55_9PEZI|nr:WD40 repeat-like protein [Piedraia hortae CBS 480.64]